MLELKEFPFLLWDELQTPWIVGLCYRERSGCVSQWLFFSSHCQSPEECFLGPHSENLVRFLEVKPQKSGVLKDCGPMEFLIFTLVHSASSNLSKLLFKCFYQFMAPVASAPGRQVLLCLWTCLSLWISGWQSALPPQPSVIQEPLLFSLFSYLLLQEHE